MRNDDGNLIYSHGIDPALTRIRMLLCGISMPDVLENQGKAAMQTNASDTLERIRSASKNDIPALIPVVIAQVKELVSVHELDPLLLQLLHTSLDDLDRIAEDIELRAPSRASGHTGSNAPDKTTARSKTSSKTPTARSKSASKHGSRTGSKKSSATGLVEGPEINMFDVRTVTKRLMLLLKASELPKHFLDTLRVCSDALKQKARCNTAIDQVIDTESSDPLRLRDEEFEDLRGEVVSFLERNLRHVDVVAVRVTKYFASIALLRETHEHEDQRLDSKTADDLDDEKDRFKEEDDDRENNVKKTEHDLRHAADDNDLDESFDRLLAILDTIQTSYYDYHRAATALAENHPKMVANEAQMYMSKLCECFGLAEYREPVKAKPQLSELEQLEAAEAAAAAAGPEGPEVFEPDHPWHSHRDTFWRSVLPHSSRKVREHQYVNYYSNV